MKFYLVLFSLRHESFYSCLQFIYERSPPSGSNPGEGEAWGKYAKLIIRITLILFCILIYATRVIVRRQSLLADVLN